MSEHSPAAYAGAGATWWIESMWDAMAEHSPVTAAYDRLLQGPPADPDPVVPGADRPADPRHRYRRPR